MTTNITETLPWTDYRLVFAEIEERGRAERDMEIARKMFARQEYKGKIDEVVQMLSNLGISKKTIDAAYAEFKSGCV